MIQAIYPLEWSFSANNAESDTMFKTTGTVNKELYDEIKWFFLSKSTIVVLILDFIVVVSIVVSVCLNPYNYINYILILGSLLIGVDCLSRPNRIARINLKRMAEATEKSENDYSVHFEEDCVVSQNLTSGGIITVKYDGLARFKKAKTVYVIFTKTNLIIPIFINCLSDEEKTGLLTFLKSHAPQLKIKI